MNKLSSAFLTALDLLKVKFFGKRIPLIVGWCITKRCNYRCKYCEAWKMPSQELNTKEICDIINEMKDFGVRKLTFTGGEPLLRDDIGEIINYAHEKNICVGINSNGSLLRTKIAELKNIDYIGLSLEGPAEAHDILRQTGSFRDVMEATCIAVANNIKVTFNTTLNTINFNYIDYLLNLAKQYKVQIVFQPSTEKLLAGEENNPVSLPTPKYIQAINKIIENKKGKYRKIIRNSLVGLEHLSYWPNLKKIKCAGGFITCRIEPEGNVFHCARVKNTVRFPLNCKEVGFKKAFYNLNSIFCRECSCAFRVEASYILQLNISALINAFKYEMDT